MHLAILIQVADVKGLTPVKAQQSPLFTEGIECKPSHNNLKFEDPFKMLDYVTEDGISARAVIVMNNLLNYFYEKQLKSSDQSNFSRSISFSEACA